MTNAWRRSAGGCGSRSGPGDGTASSAPRRRAWIGPTAHYTGHVWQRAGLSHPALASGLGRLLFALLEPAARIGSLLSGGVTLEALLLQRHRVLDARLGERIARGEVAQVLELAAGLSGRGLRLTGRHPQLRYVEADLPAMAVLKRRRLGRIGALGARHRVIALDALAEDGAASLGAAVAALDRDRGLAVVTEGLLHYLEREQVERLWRRIAAALAPFPAGVYLADIHTREDLAGLRVVGPFCAGLGAVTRSRVAIHHATRAELGEALAAAGFADVRVHRPSSFARELGLPSMRRGDVISVIEAGTPPRG